MSSIPNISAPYESCGVKKSGHPDVPSAKTFLYLDRIVHDTADVLVIVDTEASVTEITGLKWKTSAKSLPSF